MIILLEKDCKITSNSVDLLGMYSGEGRDRDGR